ncbi:MAG: hypothetical protein HY329_14980 [Chloroflexi bacterium]|nr:hypothetical protein [Chloroflexota bacterium]
MGIEAPIGELSLSRALLDPAAYPHSVRGVRLVETHISCVFLTGDFAYKLKRPVDFGFLDYSTLARRRHFCHEELRLNQRLTSDLYLDVVPVGLAAAGVRLGVKPALDYLIRMRQLPEDRMLDRLLERGAVTLADAEQLAPYRGNTFDAAEYDTLAHRAHTLFANKRKALARRAETGFVRDGHGDMRAANVCLVEPVQIFDCIEFNRRFRVGDVAGEVAFLDMDFEWYGRPDLAAVFLATYVMESGDDGLRDVLGLFTAYRALVRAKVECFRLDDPDVPVADHLIIRECVRRYLVLAARAVAREK